MEIDMRSKEYVEWTANVWKLNSERNEILQREIRRQEDLDWVAEFSSQDNDV
jgi:hypothetical protein